MKTKQNVLEVRTQQLRQQIETLLNDKMLFHNFFSTIFVIKETNTEIVVDFSDTTAKNEVISRWINTIERAIANLEISKVLTFANVNNSVNKLETNQNFAIESGYCNFKINNVLNKFTFKNYVKSNYNNQIFNIYDKIVADSNFKFSPVFISGPSGIGKTHFLNAIGNLFIEKNKKVFYINDYKFISCITAWMQKGQGEKIRDFMEWLSKIDILLFDDIQGLGNKFQTSIVALEVLNKFTDENKIVLITSDKSPTLLGGFEERFITRFSSGLQIRLNRPKKEDFLRIFKYKLNEKKLEKCTWTNDALDFLAKHFQNSIRDLEGALKSIVFFIETSEKNTENEIHFDKKKMFEIFDEKYEIEQKISPELIIETVAKYYGISVLDLKSEKRKKEFVHARDLAIWLIKNILNLTHTKVGEFFNSRKHSTIISTLKKIDILKQSGNSELNIALDKIYKQLNWSFKQKK
ncbi:chromosomal replication initiator protein DnaA [Mycoplasma sp. 'Moose RK']|uniref:chromosomal replication initiator protein DnaA n=1 Tax=Mycoplasma sp. 'Moose RK' TaxID=2780095 RepID=UPI0018C21286|nr:chromosomal replication initiator protein DnaA [Mycoplasma sp. 'Moose RK']MBG0730519.1 chromosomal replication initiator protein DnaA [Mycoplasma sp. 'Moose RK']